MASYNITINLTDRKLTLYDGAKVVKKYPVGVGKIATETPEGEFTVINKVPYPGGPFGAYWMGLSKPHYGIHGTNQPSSIGSYVSHGCIRMYNMDVLELSKYVSLGTPVRIES